MDLLALQDYAAEHHGLVTREAARRVGVSTSSWYRAINAGSLQQLFPGVARLVGAPATREQRIAAGVLAAGTGAMASHRSAAHLWGIPRPDDDPVDVMLPERGRQASLDGVVVHRPRDRKDLSPVLRRNIKTSNVLRLLCDLGAVDPRSVSAAVGHVVSTGIASPVSLRNAVDLHARRGRHGVPALRAALDDWVIDGKPADSVLEPAMRALITTYGLPPVEFHRVIHGYEVDFWVIGSRIILECDGWDSHGRDKAGFERDRRRDQELTGYGFIAVRFTYRQLTQRPAAQAERIAAIIRRWAPHLLGGDRAGFRQASRPDTIPAQMRGRR